MKEAFEKATDRLVKKIKPLHNANWNVAMEEAIEIVNQVAEEYSSSVIPNKSEKLTSSDEFCEWKLDGVYLHCQHKTDLIITCLEDEKYRYSFCPCCGKKIKVVE